MMSVAPTAPAAGERPLVSAVKQEAKRLLRLAKKSPLQITALNQALEVMAQVHGYPSWQALSRSEEPGTPAPEESRAAVSSDLYDKSRQFLVDPAHHVENLAAHVHRLSKHPSASVNVLTPHYGALRKAVMNTAIAIENVTFVSKEDLLGFNPFLLPLTSRCMLPEHQTWLADAMTIAFELTDPDQFRSLIRKNLDQPYAVIDRSDRFDFVNKKGPPSGHTKAEEVVEFLIKQGRFSEAMEVHHRLAPDLGSCWSRPSFLPGLMYAWLTGQKNMLPPLPVTGVVVFELDPLDVDHPLNASSQWMLAAYFAAMRRMPLDIIEAKNSLKNLSYGDTSDGLLWMKSMPAATRANVLENYQQAIPDVMLDIWDDLGPALLSQSVRFMASRLVEHGSKYREVATWIGYDENHEEVVNRFTKGFSGGSGPMDSLSRRKNFFGNSVDEQAVPKLRTLDLNKPRF